MVSRCSIIEEVSPPLLFNLARAGIEQNSLDVEDTSGKLIVSPVSG